MTDPELLQTLRGLDFLDEIAEHDLQQITDASEVAYFAPDKVVFREGEQVEHIHVVIEGEVALEIRVAGKQYKRIHTVGSGELLGWSPLLGSRARMTATARALSPTKTLRINARQLLALCRHNHEFGFEVMRRTAMALANRLSATRLQLMDVYKHELPAVTDEEG